MEAGLSNIFIQQFLDSQKLKHFDGVYSSNNIPQHVLKKKKFIIISNLSEDSEPGTHFICIEKKYKQYIVYNSLATPIRSYIHRFKFMTIKRHSILQACQYPLQSISSTFCGFYCIYFVLSLNYPKVNVETFSATTLVNNDEVCIKNILEIIKHIQ